MLFIDHELNVLKTDESIYAIIEQQTCEGGVHCCSSSLHEHVLFYTAPNIREELTGDPK